MICPKCQGRLHTVHRESLSIEQCERCRGIFLDHGELEHLLAAEQRFYGGRSSHGGGGHRDSPRPYRAHGDSPVPYRSHGDSPRPYRSHGDSPRPYGNRRRESFLGDLFG